MSKKVCLQAGHEGVFTGATGAPNERDFNIDISNRLKIELEKYGVEVHRVSAVKSSYASQYVQTTDFDLAVSVHYDADIYGKGGGFADHPEPSTDYATGESQKATKIFNEVYFPNAGVKYVNRSNANTRYYYWWKYLSAKTPCVIIETGVGMHKPDDYNVLHGDRERVVMSLLKSILKYLGIPFDSDDCEELKQQLKDMEIEKNKYKDEARELRPLKAENQELQTKLNNIDATYQERWENAKKKVISSVEEQQL